VVEGQVRKAVEALEFLMRGVMGGAERKARDRVEPGDEEEQIHGPEWADYWEALLEEVTPSEVVVDGAEEEETPLVESNTTATLKGIVYTTTTQPHPSSSSPATPSETVLAVGAGTQLFPNKGGPHNEPYSASSPWTTAAELARETMDEMGEAVEAVGDAAKGVADEVVDAAVKAREDVEGAKERFEERECVERGRKGWESSVFDL
jgi:hypothetical protein